MSAATRKGNGFERTVADWLVDRLGDERIDRRVKRGANDRGDLTGLRTVFGGRVVEAEVERGNDDAVVGVVVHKRVRVGDPARQYVSMSLEDFARLLEGGVTA